MFVLARDSRIDGIPAIACDAEKALREIVGYLGEKGYKRPGFMSGAKALSTALGRRRHYIEFWRQAGIEDIVELSADRYSATAGADAIRSYWNSCPPERRIDVLMCENDILAVGAMDIIRDEMGLKVPEDLAVVGFDNIALGDLPSYSLTTFDQPAGEMVNAVIDMILGRRLAENVILPGRFIPRMSA
jgi:LacI family transcriptional regulator